MLDHYKTLGVPRNASRQEIKRAFRALAKKYHPDRNAARTQWATAQIKRLIEAHRVLSHAGLREAYDRRHAVLHERERRKSSVRPKQRPEGEHPRAQAERVLYDLLGGNVAQAMELYERLVRADSGYDLSHHLELRDWVDCKFLLAEEYQRRSDFERALALYEDLYHSEAARGRFSYFAHELRDRILHVCCRDAAPACAPGRGGAILPARAGPRTHARSGKRSSTKKSPSATWPSAMRIRPPPPGDRLPAAARPQGRGEDLPQAVVRAGGTS